MLSRRSFGGCALCAAVGLVATGAEAQPQPAQTPGITRRILNTTELPGTGYVTVIGIAEIAPGITVARHTHPGVESSFVLEGELELLVQGEPPRTFKAGDGFQVPARVPHGGRAGPAGVRVAATYTVEKDKPLASPAPE